MLAAVGYLILCFMVALLGRSSRLGFFRSFLYSILLTPLLIALYLLIFSTVDSEPNEASVPAGRRKSNS